MATTFDDTKQGLTHSKIWKNSFMSARHNTKNDEDGVIAILIELDEVGAWENREHVETSV